MDARLLSRRFAGRFGGVQLLLLVLIFAAGAASARPLGFVPASTLPTAFTYQGQLQMNGADVTASCDFQFALFDSATAGNQIGSMVTLTDQQVTKGIFTVQLDFGAAAFSSSARYVATAVKCPPDTSYTTLSRQAVTAVPYALNAVGPITPESVSVAGSMVINEAGEWVGSQAGIKGDTGPAGASGAAAFYGDGSAGALAITSSTDWTITPPSVLNFQFTNITINSGATLTIPSGMMLRATGNVVIHGTIKVLPGALAVSSAGVNPGIALSAPIGSSAGQPIPQLQVSYLPFHLTYGGGAGARSLSGIDGGDGGGALAIIAQGSITIGATGAINADAVNSVNTQTPSTNGIIGGGGGGGGVLTFVTRGAIAVDGTLSVKGGNASNGFDGNGGSTELGGGGGGGGIIRLISTVQPSGSGLNQASSVAGGTAGGRATPKGTFVSSTQGHAGGASGGAGGVGGTTYEPHNAQSGEPGYWLAMVVPTPENFGW